MQFYMQCVLDCFIKLLCFIMHVALVFVVFLFGHRLILLWWTNTTICVLNLHKTIYLSNISLCICVIVILESVCIVLCGHWDRLFSLAHINEERKLNIIQKYGWARNTWCSWSEIALKWKNFNTGRYIPWPWKLMLIITVWMWW